MRSKLWAIAPGRWYFRFIHPFGCVHLPPPRVAFDLLPPIARGQKRLSARPFATTDPPQELLHPLVNERGQPGEMPGKHVSQRYSKQYSGKDDAHSQEG